MNVMFSAPAAAALAMLASSAYAGETAATLVGSFQAMCTAEPIDFARLKAKAAAMQLPVHKDVEPPADDNGYFARSVSWVLISSTGAHLLLAIESHGPRGDARGCGINSNDVDGAEMKAELISKLNLGTPVSEQDQANGLHVTAWTYGPKNSKLIFGAAAQKRPGFYLTLIDSN